MWACVRGPVPEERTVLRRSTRSLASFTPSAGKDLQLHVAQLRPERQPKGRPVARGCPADGGSSAGGVSRPMGATTWMPRQAVAGMEVMDPRVLRTTSAYEA